MDFVSENEKRELGEEDETQLSSTSRHGQRRYQPSMAAVSQGHCLSETQKWLSGRELMHPC